MNRHILFGRNKKINKQVLSILLALTVLMSMSVPSYAYDTWSEDETEGYYSDGNYTDADTDGSLTDEDGDYEEIWVEESRWKRGETVEVSINNPIPMELLDTPESNVEGYEFDEDILDKNDDIFSGDKTVTSDDSMIVAEYDNGSVAILHDDGTYEGIGADGTRIMCDPKEGKVQEKLPDGTFIENEAGGNLTVTRPDGDTIIVEPDGDTIIERDNGLITEHDADGSIRSLGIDGSEERISIDEGGVIESDEGMRLEVDGDSVTFTDSEDNTITIMDSDGEMEIEAEISNDYSIKADDESLTIIPPNGDEYEYLFDDLGRAIIERDSGGETVYDRFDDGFRDTSDDDFNMIIDENGRLTKLDDPDEDVHFVLRSNPDGSIISGQFKKDEYGELVEVKEDGSGTLEKNGDRITVDPDGEVETDGRDFEEWFSDVYGKPIESVKPDGSKEDGTIIDINGNGDQNRDDNKNQNVDQEEKQKPEETGEFETLDLNLAVYYDGASRFWDAPGFDHETKPGRNSNVYVDTNGNVKFTLPGYEYKSYYRISEDDGGSHGENRRGSREDLTLKGRITRTYTAKKDGETVYFSEGVLSEPAIWSGESDDYGGYNPETHMLIRMAGYDFVLDAEPEKCTFRIAYFTSNECYEVGIVLKGHTKWYDHDPTGHDQEDEYSESLVLYDGTGNWIDLNKYNDAAISNVMTY